MKGIIFSELLDFVERHAGNRKLEEILEQADLESGGAYTSVGNYPHHEAISIVSKASELLGLDTPELLREFGLELFDKLAIRHPEFFVGINDYKTFLKGIQTHIHDEVKKLYPDSMPPSFTVEEEKGNLIITYTSHRPMAMVALGLLEGCVKHFGVPVTIQSQPESLTLDSQARFLAMGD